MSPENTHKLMGLYMEVLILGVICTWFMLLYAICYLGCIGLKMEEYRAGDFTPMS